MYTARLADTGLGDSTRLVLFEERIERVLVQAGALGVRALTLTNHQGKGMQAAGCMA